MQSPIRRIIGYLAAVLVLGLTFIVTLQVFQRFVIERSLTWPDEAAGLLLVWVTFFGAYLTAVDDGHVRLTLVEDLLPQPYSDILRTFADIAVLFFLFVLVYYSVLIVDRTWNQTPVTVPISKGFIYLVMPVMSALMMIEVIRNNVFVKRVLGSRRMGNGAGNVQ
jgi:TRAP-type transport system small permease protein